MAVLEIKKYPEVVLKEKALTVGSIEDRHQRLIDDMIETMYAAPGIGLAAPQVGVSERIIVVDVSKTDETASLIVLFNPEIKDKEGRIESEEGCLSVPGLTVKISRFEKVAVTGLDREGRGIEIEGEGMLSRALQHEIDHLNGTLIIDRMGFLKREFFKKRRKKEAMRRD
ncbi:MAG: peptide deformylase [Thermodesulfovibrionales bacterium]|nr:peptide deformylase [Thermodesulfovibrionales bacterium]